MNLKDRLDNIKQANKISIKDEPLLQEYNNISDLFADSLQIKDFIINMLSSKKNLIFVHDNNIDKEIIIHYFYSILQKMDAVIIDNIENHINNMNNKIKILSMYSVFDMVKVFEYILYGYNSFIFGLQLASSENIVDKLKAVIALNYPNMTEKNINTLVDYSDVVYICFSKKNNGLIFISEAYEQIYQNGDILLESVLNNEDNQNESDINSMNAVIDISDSSIEINENTDDNINSDIDENIEDTDIVEETNTENSISKEQIEHKVNKYKLLKEKFKNKHNL